MMWQPIETCPQDGPYYLIGLWRGGRLFWAKAAYRGHGALRKRWFTITGASAGIPTHWAPLPEPPQ